MFTLRPYQQSAINSIREQLLTGKKRVVLYSATGSGKTELGMEMIRLALEKNKRAAFICNRIELVKQTSRRLNRSGIEHGIIQGANTNRTYEPVLVASIQTVASRGLPKTDLILIDEAHGTPGSTAYRKLIEHHKDVPIIGLTATPWSKGMAKKYEWGVMWESLTVATTIRELIDLGFLVDCDIYAPGEPDLSGVKIVAGDYHEEQLGKAVDKAELVGDIVEHWSKFANNLPTVCFATNIAHSKHICERFNSQGITAEHIDCYTNDEERLAILDRVMAEETKVISNVGVLAEGWDFPACSVMILARPTRSMIRYIQMCGRILRPYEGKEKALILDHSGTCRRLGFPTDDLPLYLDDGKPKDKETKAAEERKKSAELPNLCPKCKALMPKKLGVCPRCGEAFHTKNEVHTRPGELVQLKRGKIVQLADYGDKQRRKVYSELIGYANTHGYKQGWAWHKYKELFGDMPTRRQPHPSAPTDETLRMIKHLNIKFHKRRENENAEQPNAQ